MSVLAVELAGARIDLRLAGPPTSRLTERYGAFAGRTGPARWIIELHPGPLPPLDGMTGRVTEADGIVRLEGCERHAFLDATTFRGEALLDPYLVVLDPLVRTAMALDLSARGGCLLHAAAVVVGGVAHVVPGRSGSGKSTLGGLAGDVLADELCAVIPQGDGFRVEGTPWWKGRPGSAPLAAVWELAWGAQRADALPRAAALRHLCTNLVVPSVPRIEQAAFAVCARIAGAAPFGRLTFRLDTDVDALLRRERLAA